MPNPYSVAVLVLALIPQDPAAPTARAGLPIRFSGESGIVEIPMSERQLGWQPKFTRRLAFELLEPLQKVENDGEVPPVIKPVQDPFVDHTVRSDCFDLWVYGDLTPERKRIWLLTILSEKIAAARHLGLSTAEEEKLILAGRGDIKRYFDRVEEVRQEFEAVRKDLEPGVDFLDRLLPLSQEFQWGPFRPGSLFTKTLAKIENDRIKPR